MNSSIASLTLESADTELESHSFSGCGQLKDVSCSDPGWIAPPAAFTGSPSFFELIEPFYCEQSRLLQYRGRGGDVIIPDGITEIAKGAFNAVIYGELTGEEITSVYVPDSVTHIENMAFYAQRSLERISLPSGCETDSDAFLECGESLGNTAQFAACALTAHLLASFPSELLCNSSSPKILDRGVTLPADFCFV